MKAKKFNPTKDYPLAQKRPDLIKTPSGLAPLNNLELLSQASNATLETYRAIGRNAARYAKGVPPTPFPVVIDNMARLKHIVRTTLMHMKETEQVDSKVFPKELKVRFLENA